MTNPRYALLELLASPHSGEVEREAYEALREIERLQRENIGLRELFGVDCKDGAHVWNTTTWYEGTETGDGYIIRKHGMEEQCLKCLIRRPLLYNGPIEIPTADEP